MVTINPHDNSRQQTPLKRNADYRHIRYIKYIPQLQEIIHLEKYSVTDDFNVLLKNSIFKLRITVEICLKIVYWP